MDDLLGIDINHDKSPDTGGQQTPNLSQDDLNMSYISAIHDEEKLTTHLEKIYKQDPKKLVEFMKKSIKRYTTKASLFDQDKIKIASDALISEKKRILESYTQRLSGYWEFMWNIDTYESWQDLTVSEEVGDIIHQLETLKEQYSEFLDLLHTKINENSPLATSERLVDYQNQQAIASSGFDKITFRKRLPQLIDDETNVVEERVVDRGEQRNPNPYKSQEIINDDHDELSKVSQSKFRYSLDTSKATLPVIGRKSIPIAGNLSNNINISKVNTSRISNTLYDTRQSATNTNQHSTIQPSFLTSSGLDRNVRFTGIDEGESSLNESWRTFNLESRNISELALAKIIKSISKITQIKISSKLCDVDIMALNKSRKPELKDLNEKLEKKIQNVPDDCAELKNYAVDAFTESNSWLDRLEDLMNERNLHMTSDRKYSEPLKLAKFTGYKDVKSNVYEFFKMFNIISRGFTSDEKSHYLYNNYLDDEVKRAVRHINDDFAKMKICLVTKYGDVNRLLAIKKSQIRSLPSIHFKSNQNQKLEFIKGYVEVLEQVQSLVDLNVEDYPSMENEIFSHSNVMDLSALLPRFLQDEFAEKYVKDRDSNGLETVSGKRAFHLLLTIMKINLNSLEFSIENYQERKDPFYKKDVDRKEKEKNETTSTVMVVGNDVPKEKCSKPAKGLMVMNPKKTEKFIKTVCFVHDEMKKKVSECETGKCPIFLNMKPEDRLRFADQRGLCNLCFLYICKKKSPGQCKYKGEISTLLSCSFCVSRGVERNVLLCGEHNNKDPKILDALKNFLAGYELGTAVTMMFISPNNESSDDVAVINKASAVETRDNTNVFNVTNGNLIPKSDVSFKINKDSKDAAIYPMQLLNICGKQTLVMFDSGASGEAINAELAEQVEMSIIDTRPQSFRVAGGGIVSTNNPLYECTLGPDIKGNYHTFSLLGMEKISEKLPNVDLQEMGKEFRCNQKSSPLSKESLPVSIGGSDIKLIIGIRQSLLFPTLIMVLDSGLQVWRSQFQDIFGSSIIFAGPHWSIKNAYKSVNLSKIEDPFSSFFHTSYDIYRDMKMFINPITNEALNLRDRNQHGSLKQQYNTITPIDKFNIPSEAIDDDNFDSEYNILPRNSDIKTVWKEANIETCNNIANTSIANDNTETESTEDKSNSYDFNQDYNSTMISSDEFDMSFNVIMSTLESDTTSSMKSSIESSVDNNISIFKTSIGLEKAYAEDEMIGCTVDFRCGDCFDCLKCLQSEKLRAVSVKDAAEDLLIAKSVSIDVSKKQSICVYPFTSDPDEYLSKKWANKTDNFKMAENVFKAQTKKSQDVKDSVIKFNQELYQKGYVIPLKDLPDDIQSQISNASFKHYFCWRSVFKAGSLSTPARLVVDPTVSSFNDVLAKGSTCLTNLFQIMVNWRSHPHVFVSDISKMFNSLKLKPEMYRYSLYLFSEALNKDDPIEIWVILTLMYGLRSAANQCTHALKEIAEKLKDKYPLAYKIITCYTYMDDSSNGSSDLLERDKMIQELTELLPLGGFVLKVVVKSGESPPEKASADGVYTSFCGYKWNSLNDYLMLNSSDMNFNHKRRGIKKPNEFTIDTDDDVERLINGKILTRKMMLGKTLEMYDLNGLLEPLKSRLKLDLQLLKDLDFDAAIPMEYQDKWVSNLKMIHNARYIKCARAFIPVNAVDPNDMELIACSDAAERMSGCSVYARFKLSDGSYSCQLITGRSKTAHFTIPRNELEGIALAAQTTFTLSKVLGSRISRILFVSDSTISICWICNPNSKLKQFVYARVRLIHRLFGADCFYHIPGADNPSDLLTRGDVTCDDVGIGTRWHDGDPWMKLEVDEMPIKTYKEICKNISKDEQIIIDKESHPISPASAGSDLFSFDTSGVVEGYSAETELFHSYMHDDIDAHMMPCKDSNDCECMKNLEDGDINTPAIYKVAPRVKRSYPKSKSKPVIRTNASPYPVDLVYHGFRKSFTIIAIIFRFIVRTKHSVHMSKGQSSSNCKLCSVLHSFKTTGLDKIQPYDSTKIIDPNARVICSPLDFYLAWHHICKVGTSEVKSQFNNSQLDDYIEKDGVLFGGGRLSHPEIKINNPIQNPLIDGLDFVQPVFLNSSSLTYSLCMYVHWELIPHSGTERTMSNVLRIISVERLRKLVKYIRDSCPRCRYLLKKHFIPVTGNQSTYSLMRAPPFFSTIIDIAGIFPAFDTVKKRSVMKCYFLIQCCLITGAVAVGVLEDLSVTSIVMALSRSASRYGWFKYLVLDNQSSFHKLKDLRISFKDLQNELWHKQKVILDFNTPLGHQEHGRIESKVKALKEFLEKAGETGRKHSFIAWETIGMNIAATINGLPICVNQDDRTSLGEYSLISPNNFLIGRNNSRSPDSFVYFEGDPVKALDDLAETDKKLQDLLGEFVHRFIPGVRYTKENTPALQDVVLFVSKEAERSRNIKYHYGRVIETCVEGRTNKVKILYRNATEAVNRIIDRNVKDIVLIKGIDEIDFNTESHFLAASIQRKFL